MVPFFYFVTLSSLFLPTAHVKHSCEFLYLRFVPMNCRACLMRTMSDTDLPTLYCSHIQCHANSFIFDGTSLFALNSFYGILSFTASFLLYLNWPYFVVEISVVKVCCLPNLMLLKNPYTAKVANFQAMIPNHIKSSILQ